MQNKLYTTVAEMHNELKNLRGEHDNIIESIKDISSSNPEIIEARGRHSSLQGRFEEVESETNNNTVNFAKIDGKIESVRTDLINRIPEVDSVVIKHENSGIGVRLEGVKHVYEKITRLAPGEKEVVRLDKEKTVSKSYVKAYGEFLQDFVNDVDEDVREFKVSADNTTYNKSAVRISNDKLSLLVDGNKIIDCSSPYMLGTENKRCEVPGVFYAAIETKSEDSIAKLFNDEKFVVNTGTLKVKVDFMVPTELTNVFTVVSWNGNSGATNLKLTFEDGTTTDTQPLTNPVVNIDTSSTKKVSSLEIHYGIVNQPNNKGFSVDILEFKRKIFVEQSDPVTTHIVTDIGDVYKNSTVLAATSENEDGTDVRFALTTLEDEDKSITFIPQDLFVDYRNFSYPDGQNCIGRIVSKEKVYVPFSYDMSINTKDVASNNKAILGNNEMIGGFNSVEGSLTYNNRIIMSLSALVNGTRRPVKIYDFSNNKNNYSDGNINAKVFRVSDEILGINITSDTFDTLEDLTLTVNAPYNVEANKEVWNSVRSTFKESYNTFTSLGAVKEIVTLNSEYNVSYNSISLNGVSKIDSNRNGNDEISYSVITSDNSIVSKSNYIDENGMYAHNASCQAVKLPVTIFVSTSSSHKVISDTIKSRVNKYKGVYDRTILVSRNEVNMRTFVGNKSNIVRISPDEKSGDMRYFISFDGKLFLSYDYDEMKWTTDGIGMSKHELEKLNETILDGVRNNSEWLYVKCIFDTTGELGGISISFDRRSVCKINTHEVQEKGVRATDMPKIDFFDVGSEIKAFKITASLKSITKLSSPKLSKYTLSNYSFDKWIPIEYTDVREYMLDNGNMVYKNKHDVETRFVKTVYTDTESTVASDMNKQSYIESIDKINENHKLMSEKIDSLMHNISILMKTLAGPTGSDYVNNFLINNYREFESGIVEDGNVFVINDVHNIVSVEVWSVVSSNFINSINLRVDNKHAHEFVTNNYVDYTTTGATVLTVADTGNAYRASENGSDITSTGYKTKDYTLTCNVSMSKTPYDVLNGYEQNGTGSWYSYYWYYSYLAYYDLSASEKYVDYIIDFGFNKYVEQIHSLSAGGYNTGSSDGIQNSCYQKTSISYSFDNKEYVELHSFTGHNRQGGYDSSGVNYPIKKKARYIRIRLEKTVSGPTRVAIKHFGIDIADDDYKYDQDCILYNKEPIDTTHWESINKMQYAVTVNQPICDIRFMLSNNANTWTKISNGSIYNYSSIDFSNAMTLDDVKALRPSELDMFTGGKLYVAAILRTSDRYRTPVLSNISFDYTTSQSADNLIKLDQHDYSCIYSTSDNRITITNTSGGQKKFKVLVS